MACTPKLPRELTICEGVWRADWQVDEAGGEPSALPYGLRRTVLDGAHLARRARRPVDLRAGHELPSHHCLCPNPPCNQRSRATGIPQGHRPPLTHLNITLTHRRRNPYT